MLIRYELPKKILSTKSKEKRKKPNLGLPSFSHKLDLTRL